MSDDAFLSFELLGVAFSLVGEAGDLRTALDIRYGAAPGTRSRKDSRLEVRIERKDFGWEITDGDRPPKDTSEAGEALDLVDGCILHAVTTRKPELFFAHGGAVALGDQGILLPGLARAGKSILVLALIQAGAHFLSDELIVYDHALDRLLAFPRAIRLHEEVSPHFPDLASQFCAVGDIRFLPPHVVGPDVLQENAALSTLVIPSWDPAATDEVRPTPRAGALERLLEAQIPTAEGPPPGATAAARTFTLRYRDPHIAAALLLEALG